MKPVMVISTAGSCLFLAHYYSVMSRQRDWVLSYVHRGLIRLMGPNAYGTINDSGYYIATLTSLLLTYFDHVYPYDNSYTPVYLRCNIIAAVIATPLCTIFE